ncbi:MAG TPA: hypothetical protein VGG05_21285 [Pseudonocardiaceae bacterium]|jgi:hypothetical protein
MRIIEVAGSTARHAVVLRRRDAALLFLLVPMTHVACPEFYEQVRSRLGSCDLIVAGRSWQVGAWPTAVSGSGADGPDPGDQGGRAHAGA